MAFASSGAYVLNEIDVKDATQLTFDYSLSTHKLAYYNNTLTPDFSANSAYSATNEVTGTNVPAGGSVIGSPTVSEAPAGSVDYDMADQVTASATAASIRGGIFYADALAGNNLMLAQTYGADFSVTAGTLTIQFAAGGVRVDDVTP